MISGKRKWAQDDVELEELLFVSRIPVLVPPVPIALFSVVPVAVMLFPAVPTPAVPLPVIPVPVTPVPVIPAEAGI